MINKLVKVTPLVLLEKWETFILGDYNKTKGFLTTANPELLEEISKKKALAQFRRAAAQTPAYKRFLEKNKIKPSKIWTIKQFNELVPQTTKKNYIKKYKPEERCRKGKLPTHGNVDESGGTSGIATNWIHDLAEENLLFKAVNFEFNYAFNGDKKQYFVISAWSSGPWATGVKFCELMEKIALVKNTSTDQNDVISTLKMFGKNRNYLIGGYPPFIKNLIDENQKTISWKDYNINLVIGGEGVTLDWVHYVKSKLKNSAKIVSSYGASDVDIGIGFETPITFAIRQAVAKNKELRTALFQSEDIPMIFQYNPTVHYIEEVESKQGPEFHITQLDRNTIVDKIKYNIRDKGKRTSYKEMMQILAAHEPHLIKKMSQRAQQEILHLPFLCIFGRSDGTLSFDGANVFPHQIQDAILKEKELSTKTNRFKIEKKHDKSHNVEFHIHVELKKKQKVKLSLKKKYLQIILKHLIENNPDYKESYSKNKKLKPYINLYPNGHKFFSPDDTKAKDIYIVKN